MTTDIRRDVEGYIKNNRSRYIDLQRECMTLVDTVKRDTAIIRETYTRSKSQGEGNELKDISKIVDKLIEMRRCDQKADVRDIFDIVGLTVVVYYNDNIPEFIGKFQQACNGSSLKIDPYVLPDGVTSISRVHKDKGYHATHLKIVSTDPAFRDIRMEVQVKTMLHDAWGSKTHDLTYKPSGELDPRLKKLMESFGDSLQAIEIQSETLRDSIIYRVNLLRDLRRSARLGLAAKLERIRYDAEPVKQHAYDACFAKIKNKQEHLTYCRTNDLEMEAILAEVDRLEGVGIAAVTRLELVAYVASLRFDTKLAPYVDSALRAWQSDERAQLPKGESGHHIHAEWVTAAILHQTNRLGEAIDRLRHFLEGEEPDEQNAILYLNLANFMIETYFESPKQAEKFGGEVRTILEQVEPLFRAGGALSSNEKEFLSTKGAYLIVYGTTEKDWRSGIKMCLESNDVEDGGLEYQRLFETLGWHRIIGAA